jgi:peroxiredoxin
MALGVAMGSCVLGVPSALGQSAPAHETSPREARARSWLGIELAPAGPGARGVPVRHVVRGSPADRAGLRQGDAIVSVSGAVVRRPDDVVREVSSYLPGAVVRVRAMRGASELTVDATLGRFPGSGEMLRMDKVGAPAPRFARLSRVAGNVPARIDDLHGKVVVIDFWMTACPACRFTAPQLSALQEELGPRGLVVLGITDDAVRDAAQTAESYGMRFAVGTDESFETQRAYGVSAFPTMFVVDRRGIVRDVMVGYEPRHGRALQALVEKLLAEPAP